MDERSDVTTCNCYNEVSYVSVLDGTSFVCMMNVDNWILPSTERVWRRLDNYPRICCCCGSGRQSNRTERWRCYASLFPFRRVTRSVWTCLKPLRVFRNKHTALRQAFRCKLNCGICQILLTFPLPHLPRISFGLEVMSSSWHLPVTTLH